MVTCNNVLVDSIKTRFNLVEALVKEKTGSWVGDLEARTLRLLIEAGRPLYLREIATGLGEDVRRVHDALKRLIGRGFVEKIDHGLYKARIDVEKYLSLKVRKLGRQRIYSKYATVKEKPLKVYGTRVVGGGVVGPFFDNVRGYGCGGYVGGDRGRVLGLGDLGFFERISYCEVLYRVQGLFVPGQLAIYTNGVQDGDECVRVEWRPPRGFVKRNGVCGAVGMYWEVVQSSARALVELLLWRAPLGVRRRFLEWFHGELDRFLVASLSGSPDAASGEG